MIKVMILEPKEDIILNKREFVVGKRYVGYNLNGNVVIRNNGQGVVIERIRFAYYRLPPHLDYFNEVGTDTVRNKKELKEYVNAWNRTGNS